MYYNEILSTNCKNDNNIRLAMKVLDFFLMLAQLKKASDVSNFPILLSFSTSRHVTFLEQDFCGFLVGVAFLVSPVQGRRLALH